IRANDPYAVIALVRNPPARRRPGRVGPLRDRPLFAASKVSNNDAGNRGEGEPVPVRRPRRAADAPGHDPHSMEVRGGDCDDSARGGEAGIGGKPPPITRPPLERRACRPPPEPLDAASVAADEIHGLDAI